MDRSIGFSGSPGQLICEVAITFFNKYSTFVRAWNLCLVSASRKSCTLLVHAPGNAKQSKIRIPQHQRVLWKFLCQLTCACLILKSSYCIHNTKPWQHWRWQSRFPARSSCDRGRTPMWAMKACLSKVRVDGRRAPLGRILSSFSAASAGEATPWCESLHPEIIAFRGHRSDPEQRQTTPTPRGTNFVSNTAPEEDDLS